METKYIVGIDPAKLDHSWTAVVILHNEKIISIWHTAWPSTKESVKKIVSIASDLPKRTIIK